MTMRIVIEVSGGMVQTVYADGPVSVEVVDLDVSEFPGLGDPTKDELRERLLEATRGLEPVW
jgi:hypothetical protein